MTTITPTGGLSSVRTPGSPASSGLALFAMPMGAPTVGLSTPPAPASPVHHEKHHGRRYAAIALTAAALVLAAMGVFQYAQTLDTVSTPVPAVPAEYAGVSLPQAMRLADQAAATTTVPAEYAGVSLPQAMRLG